MSSSKFLIRAGLVMTLAGASCGSNAERSPATTSECSPRRWSFDTASGARIEGQDLQIGTAPATEPLRVAPGPDGPMNVALGAKVALTRETYFFRVSLPACAPTDENSLLGKRLTARVFVEGPALPGDSDFATLVVPHMDGPRLKAGAWTTIEGRLEPPTPEISPRHYREAKDLVFAFTYTGTEPWSGTLWLDDVSIQN